jgi:hypothetical protein
MISLDTGSIEIWVDPDCDSATKHNVSAGFTDSTNGVDNPDVDSDYCDKIARYDPSKSSTVKDAGLAGTVLGYGDHTSATINYHEDTLNIAGKETKL